MKFTGLQALRVQLGIPSFFCKRLAVPCEVWTFFLSKLPTFHDINKGSRVVNSTHN
jgi:hypothetical protein